MKEPAIEWDLGAYHAAVRRGGARTADDVTVTSDGRRIDTREKMLALIEELNSLPRPDQAQ